MMALHALRLPGPHDATAAAYKDWLHLNIFHHPTGSVGLINVSLHGDPLIETYRAIGTVLVHTPKQGWRGNVQVGSFAEASIGPVHLSIDRIAIGSDPLSSAIVASAALPDEQLTVEVAGTPDAPPLSVELPIPLGPGWISWFVVPRLAVTGKMTLGRMEIDLGYQFESGAGYSDSQAHGLRALLGINFAGFWSEGKRLRHGAILNFYVGWIQRFDEIDRFTFLFGIRMRGFLFKN